MMKYMQIVLLAVSLASIASAMSLGDHRIIKRQAPVSNLATGIETSVHPLGGPGFGFGFGPGFSYSGHGLGANPMFAMGALGGMGGFGLGGFGFGLPFGPYGTLYDGPFSIPFGPPAFGPHRDPTLRQIIPEIIF